MVALWSCRNGFEPGIVQARLRYVNRNPIAKHNEESLVPKYGQNYF